MPFAVTQLPDEPIVIVSVELPVDQFQENFLAVNASLARVVNEADEQLHIIYDVREQEVTYSDVLLIVDLLRNVVTGLQPGRVPYTYLVGTHPVLQVAINKFQQELGFGVQILPTLDAALAIIRASLDDEDA